MTNIRYRFGGGGGVWTCCPPSVPCPNSLPCLGLRCPVCNLAGFKEIITKLIIIVFLPVWACVHVPSALYTRSPFPDGHLGNENTKHPYTIFPGKQKSPLPAGGRGRIVWPTLPRGRMPSLQALPR